MEPDRRLQSLFTSVAVLPAQAQPNVYLGMDTVNRTRLTPSRESLVKKFVVSLLTSAFVLFGWATTLATLAPAVSAQADRPLLTISAVDATQFPTVTLFVYGENLGANVATVPLSITEDTIPQPMLQDRFVDVGVQTAFLIDASRSILDPGNSGAPRYQEVTNAVHQLVTELHLLTAQADWLAAYTIGQAATDYQELIPWSQDHNAVVNALTQQQPAGSAVNTSLFGLLNFGLDQFADTPVPPNRQKFIVIFSDGVDVISALDLENITNRAERLGVRIHTVLLGRGTVAARDNMQRIATLTGGLAVTLNTLDDLAAIWDGLAQARGQRLITYRTTRAQASEVAVIATLPSGRQLLRNKTFPAIGALPVEIRVLQPADNVPVERSEPTANAPLTEYQPRALEVVVEFRWPDGHPRRFQRVEYELNNQLVLREEEPFDQATFSIETLGEGSHRLQVKAIDELGLTSEARPLVVPLRLLQQASPAPTLPAVTDTSTPTVSPTAVETIMAPAAAASTVITSATGSAGDDATASTTSVAPAASPAARINDLGLWLAESLHNATGLAVTPLLALALAFLPLLLLLAVPVLLTRRRRPRPGAFDLVGSAPYFEQGGYTEPQRIVEMDDVTEPAVVPYNIAPAYLVYQNGGEQLPKKFPVEAGREVRIGRKREFCDLVIDDKRISRLHAVIAEKDDGFHIRDEGSAGGTFVNRRQLGVSADWLLKHGDLINFNTIEYRFELADQEPLPPSGGIQSKVPPDQATQRTSRTVSTKDATEFYVRRGVDQNR